MFLLFLRFGVGEESKQVYHERETQIVSMQTFGEDAPVKQ